MKTRHIALATLCLALAACGDGGAKAPTEARPEDLPKIKGTIVYIDGEATLYRDGAESKLSLADEVRSGDSIAVAEDSSCELALSGVGTIRLRAGSTATINGLDDKKRVVDVTMAKGSALMSIQKLSAADSFMVKTQSVAMGVRGTRFLVSLSEAGITTLAVAEGAVAVYPRKLIDTGVYDPSTGSALLPVDAFPLIGAGMQCDFAETTFAPVEGAILKAKAGEAGALEDFEKAMKEVRYESVPLKDDSLRPLEDISGITSNPLPSVEVLPSASYKESVASADKDKPAPEKAKPEPAKTEPGVALPPPDPSPALPSSAVFRISASKEGVGKGGGARVGYFSSAKAGAMEKPYAEGDVALELSSGEAIGKVEGGEYAVEVSSPAEGPGGIRAVPKARFALKPGRVYLLGFTARGDAGKAFEVAALPASGGASLSPYVGHRAQAERTRYVQPFYYSGPGELEALVQVSLGSGKGRLYLSDLSIRDSGASMAGPDPAANLVVNGGFSNGLASWWTMTEGSAKALFFVEGGFFTCVPTASGRESASLRLVTATAFPLEAGRTYRVEFDAWCSRIDEFSLFIGEGDLDLDGDGNPRTPYARGLDVPVTKAKARYVAEFTMPARADPGARLAFEFGGIGSSVSIDNVVLTLAE